MSHYSDLQSHLKANSYTWLVTGVAGFIGSNLLEALLTLDQKVIGIDNFSTGHRKNLTEVENKVSQKRWRNFEMVTGDITDYKTCCDTLVNVDYVLHQAALGSVPRSLNDPISTNLSNVNGFLNVLEAARRSEVLNFVYAASSSTYGDHVALPKREDTIGKPLSPYAVTKYVNELYADTYMRCYGFSSIGLRYFNVFGQRQDPSGAYAAVIPKWINAMSIDQNIQVYGDGETSRDFCFVDNAVQANLLAAVSKIHKAEVINIAVGQRTSLNQLFNHIREELSLHQISYEKIPEYLSFRKGDVRHSLASIEKAKALLGYEPLFDVSSGLKQTVEWFLKKS